MDKECVICKREIGDLEEGPYRWEDDGKLGYICGECYDGQGVVEGREKAWQRYQEHGDYISKHGRSYDGEEERAHLKDSDDKAEKTRQKGEREQDYSRDK